MRKFLFSFFVIAFAFSSASADNYFSLRTTNDTVVNGTLRIDPSHAESYAKMYMTAHFDGYLDHWYITMAHPDTMRLYVNPADAYAIKEGSDMNVPYINISGENAVFNAQLLTKTPNQPNGTNTLYSYFSSTISDYGYWDQFNNNTYIPYGTVKWAQGYHSNMIEFSLWIPYGILDGDITLNASLSSGLDWRGVPTVNQNSCITNIHVHVGFKRGDVNGDTFVNINDITQLNDWLENSFQGANIYHLDASDVNGDGILSIADVTTLSDIILGA